MGAGASSRIRLAKTSSIFRASDSELAEGDGRARDSRAFSVTDSQIKEREETTTDVITGQNNLQSRLVDSLETIEESSLQEADENDSQDRLYEEESVENTQDKVLQQESYYGMQDSLLQAQSLENLKDTLLLQDSEENTQHDVSELESLENTHNDLSQMKNLENTQNDLSQMEYLKNSESSNYESTRQSVSRKDVETIMKEAEECASQLQRQLTHYEKENQELTERVTSLEDQLIEAQIKAEQITKYDNTIQCKNQRIQMLEEDVRRSQEELSAIILKHKRKVKKARLHLTEARQAASLTILELEEKIKNLCEASLSSGENFSPEDHCGGDDEVIQDDNRRALIIELSSQVSRLQEKIQLLEKIVEQKDAKIKQLEFEIKTLQGIQDNTSEPGTEYSDTFQPYETNMMKDDIERILSPLTYPVYGAKEGIESWHVDNHSVCCASRYKEKPSRMLSPLYRSSLKAQTDTKRKTDSQSPTSWPLSRIVEGNIAKDSEDSITDGVERSLQTPNTNKQSAVGI
ncbi:coiled-coil domain-containing protein 192 isoform 2-T2 [Discoglossus pictus]